MIVVGLFPEGLLIPTTVEIRTDMETDARDQFGPNFPLGDDTLAGFIVGAVAERLDILGQGLEAVFAAGDPDKATGIAQRQLGLVTGTIAPDPAPSTVVETLCGDPATVIPSGSGVRTPDTLRAFVTRDDATLVTVPNHQTNTEYSAGDPDNNIPGNRVTHASLIFQCTVPGTSGSSSPPDTQDFDIVDGGVHWTWIGDGTAAADVAMRSVDEGPIQAIARGLTEITSEIAGWNTATNLQNAAIGVSEMGDEDFRIFRDQEAQGEGTGTPESIQSKALKLTGVTTAVCFSNPGEEPDADGLDGHCVELLVEGGDDGDIAAMLLSNVAGGIGTRGNTSAVAVDAEGKSHTMRFSRPVVVPIYVDVTLTKNSGTYVGDTAVRTLVAGLTATLGIGSDAVASRVSAQVFQATGVVDVPRSGSLGGVLISISPSPTTDATIPINSRSLAGYDVTRIAVHSSDA